MLLGELLKNCRLHDGLSQAALAKRAGVTPPTVRLCEKSKGNIASYMALVHSLGRQLFWSGVSDPFQHGLALAEQRKKRGCSQRSAAKIIGATQPTIVALERSFRGRVVTLERYLNLVGLTPHLIRIDHPEPPEALPQCSMIQTQNDPGQDQMFSPHELAKHIIDHFPLDGVVLDACRDGGLFYDQYPDHVGQRWCDAILGRNRDFMDWRMPVDWIVSKPLPDKLREFLGHGMTVADNVVFQTDIYYILNRACLAEIRQAGFGLKEVFMVPEPRTEWPSFDSLLAAIHFQRGWSGPCSITGNLNDG